MRFIDLFAGVGGFRLGMERIGHECVWSCENDRWCRAVYRYHWGETPAGDARQVRPDEIPNFDLLCAGFPCQSFSVAGKREGFRDSRGTLFYEICRIARAKGPRLLLLENVAGLLSVDRGETFGAILQELGNLGYGVEWQVLNSKNHGVPQNRPRVFIVGHLGGIGPRAVFPVTEGDGGDDEVAGEAEARGQGVENQVASALRGGDKWEQVIAEGEPFMIHNTYGGFGEEEPRVFDKHSPTIRTPKGGGHLPYIVEPTILKKHRRDEIRDHGSVCPALTESHEHHGGTNPPLIVRSCLTPDRMKKRQHGRRFKENGEPMFTLTGQDIHGIEIANAVDPDGYLRFGHRPRDEDGKPQLLPIGYRRIRRATPREYERLQAFPDDWTRWGIGEDGKRIEISDTQRYKMMGNAVTVNVVEFIARRLPA